MARRCRDRQWFMSMSFALTPPAFWSYPHILYCADPFSTLLHKEAHNYVFRNLTSIPCLPHSRIGAKSLIGLSLQSPCSPSASIYYCSSQLHPIVHSRYPSDLFILSTIAHGHYILYCTLFSFFLSIKSTCTYVSLLRSSISVDRACTL